MACLNICYLFPSPSLPTFPNYFVNSDPHGLDEAPSQPRTTFPICSPGLEQSLSNSDWLRNENLTHIEIIKSNDSILSCFFKKYLFIFGERGGRKRGKEISLLETLIHCFSYAPHWNLQRTSALTRDGTSNLSLCWTTPHQLSHTGQGYFFVCLLRKQTLVFM